jgi:hypothetical protein
MVVDLRLTGAASKLHRAQVPINSLIDVLRAFQEEILRNVFLFHGFYRGALIGPGGKSNELKDSLCERKSAAGSTPRK